MRNGKNPNLKIRANSQINPWFKNKFFKPYDGKG